MADTIELDPRATETCIGCGAFPGIRCAPECEARYGDNTPNAAFPVAELDPHAPECVECGALPGTRCATTCAFYRHGPLTAWVQRQSPEEQANWPAYAPGDPAGKLGYGAATSREAAG